MPLSEKGIEEAIDAGRRISYIPIDKIFTSSLIRAQMTAMLAMTQHRGQMVILTFLDILLSNIYTIYQKFFTSHKTRCLTRGSFGEQDQECGLNTQDRKRDN